MRTSTPRRRVLGLLAGLGVAACAPSPTTPRPTASVPPPSASPSAKSDGLADPHQKEIAMMLISSAENSSLDWRAQYGYIEYNVEGNAKENRGYTGGLVGFTTRTSDLLAVVRDYTTRSPDNPLARFVPALEKVDGTPSRAGRGRPFVAAWQQAGDDPVFRSCQDDARDAMYFNPAVRRARADGLADLGQFAYYDAAVTHGVDGMTQVCARALATATAPADEGSEADYLAAFLAARIVVMRQEEGHQDVTRVTDAQRVFLRAGNLSLRLPLVWHVYGDRYELTEDLLAYYREHGKLP